MLMLRAQADIEFRLADRAALRKREREHRVLHFQTTAKYRA
jgi:hypothetical protein